MKILRAAILTLSISAWPPVQAAPPRSVSPSRQFVIYGADAKLRGTISELGEQTKTNLLALLRQRDEWKTAIIVNLQMQQANLPEIPPTDFRVSQTGFGVKLQLDLTMGKRLDGSLIERQLLRAILLEMIYRGQDDVMAGTTLVNPPDWLLEGVLALTPGRERESLMQALSTTDQGKSLQEFLAQRFSLLDSAGRILYKAYSVALIQLLLEQGGGGTRLAKYIANLSHGSNSFVADLKEGFPGLGNDLEKKWRSTVDRLKEHPTYQLLTFTESERRLDELLQFKISSGARNRSRPEAVNLSELAGRRASPDEKAAADQMSQALLLLVGTAHPVMRPVASEYEQIAALLARGRRRGIAKRLSRLEITRQQLAARMDEVDDYMNWFEATQMEGRSGAFNSYFKAANKSDVSASRRRDPLSVYLDAVEDQVETSGLE